MKRILIIIISSLTLFILFTNESKAQLYVNTDVGIYIPHVEEPESQPGFLLEAKYGVNEYLRVGANFAYYFYYRNSSVIGSYNNFTMPVTLVGELGYDLNDFRPFLGLNFGMYRQGTSTGNISASQSFLGAAIVPGFEYKLSEIFALNANFKYHYIFHENNTFKAFGFNAGASFKF